MPVFPLLLPSSADGCSTSESNNHTPVPSHTLAAEADPGGRVWVHTAPPALVPADWMTNKVNNSWPAGWPEDSLSGSEMESIKR